MNKVLARCIFVVSVGVYVCLSFSAPWALGDSNEFLKGFVGHELLSLLGVIVAITLASAGNLHLQFNRIEEAAEDTILFRTRMAVKRAAGSLIALFGLAFLIVVLKPLIPEGDFASSLINGLAVLIVIFNILVLIELSQLVFKIKPLFQLFEKDNDQ